jgi:hypothetical protein
VGAKSRSRKCVTGESPVLPGSSDGYGSLLFAAALAVGDAELGDDVARVVLDGARAYDELALDPDLTLRCLAGGSVERGGCYRGSRTPSLTSRLPQHSPTMTTSLYAVCRYLQKVSKFSVPKALQSVASDVSSSQSVGAKLNRHN